MELITFSKVSRVWKKILEENKGPFCSTVEQCEVFENSMLSI